MDKDVNPRRVIGRSVPIPVCEANFALFKSNRLRIEQSSQPEPYLFIERVFAAQEIGQCAPRVPLSGGSLLEVYRPQSASGVFLNPSVEQMQCQL
jgi:hypothetical protein